MRSRQARTTASQVVRPASMAATISLAVSSFRAALTSTSTRSIQLDVETLDQRRPGLAGLADDVGGLLRRDRGRIESDLEKALLVCRVADDLAQLGVKHGHDVLGRFGRRKQHEVNAGVQAGQPLLR